MTSVLILQGLILLSLWVVMVQVIKQQGRLLLQIEELGQRLTRAGFVPIADVEPEPATALAVGAELPDFQSTDLEGRTVSPGTFRGRRVLLIHWSPDCGFCTEIAPDLARLQAPLQTQGTELVLAAHGEPEAIRAVAAEAGLTATTIPIDSQHPLMQSGFAFQGTPVAYLLDEQGRVAQPLAQGGEAILELARAQAGVKPPRRRLPGERPLSESRFERNGLKPGTPAPAFCLPDLQGQTVCLEQYRGRRVLLIFSDPDCGPCSALAPHLSERFQSCLDAGLQLILVARGDLEANRRKAQAHGFAFPVVIQERWTLSQKYGIFAVPVAFLIDEDGIIAASVARGVDEILALMPQGQTASSTH